MFSNRSGDGRTIAFVSMAALLALVMFACCTNSETSVVYKAIDFVIESLALAVTVKARFGRSFPKN